MRTLLINSFQTAKRQWRHILVVYGFQFLLAITLGAQAFQVLESSIGHSMEISKLLAGYDHTVFSDFLNVHGASITPLLGQLRWLLLVYLLFSVFLNAGLLAGVIYGDRKWMSFWQGGAAYFFPFLKIGILFTAFIALLGATFFGTFAAKWQSTIEIFPSEKYTVWLLYVLIGIFLLVAAFVYLWSVFTRLHYIKTTSNKMRLSLRAGLSTAWRHFRSSFGILMVYGLLMLLVAVVYWLVEQRWGMTTAALIVVFFVLQQLFVLFRIAWRVALYDGLVRNWEQKTQ